MDGWDHRWEYQGSADDWGYGDVPSNGDSTAEYFWGLFYGAWYESLLTFHWEQRIWWSPWRTGAVPHIRKGVVECRMRYLLYWRRWHTGEWREVDGVNGYGPAVSGLPGGSVAQWQEDRSSGRSRHCFQLRLSSWDEPQRIHWIEDA